jgi:hypothetical protein
VGVAEKLELNLCTRSLIYTDVLSLRFLGLSICLSVYLSISVSLD